MLRGLMPVAQEQLMEKLVALAKRRGFLFQSSELYGGINGAWDYGPLGVELKRNVKDAWWKAMVRDREDVVGLDGADPHAPDGVEGLGARVELRRPDGRLQEVQEALSRRRDRARVRDHRQGADGVPRSRSARAS